MKKIAAKDLPADQGDLWWTRNVVIIEPGDGNAYRIIGVTHNKRIENGERVLESVDYKLSTGESMSFREPDEKVHAYGNMDFDIPNYVQPRSICADKDDEIKRLTKERDEARAMINDVLAEITKCYERIAEDYNNDYQAKFVLMDIERAVRLR
jgi:hypothetical protein